MLNVVFHLFRKNKIEVLQDGRWQAIETAWNMKRMGWLFLTIAVIFITVAIVIFPKQISQIIGFNSVTPNIASNTEKAGLAPEAHKRPSLIGKIKLGGNSNMFLDRQGRVFHLENQKLKIDEGNLRAIKLTSGEFVAGVADTPQGSVIAVNSSDDGKLVKFFRLRDKLPILEEKAVFGAQVAPSARHDGLFLTEEGKFIWRDRGGVYHQISVPNKQTNISDYGVFGNYIYVLDTDEGIWRAKTADLKSEDNRWQRIEKQPEVAGEHWQTKEQAKSSELEAGGSDQLFILQAFENQILVSNHKNQIEEWQLEGLRATKKTTLNGQNLKEAKPIILTYFTFVDLTDANLNNAWCLINTENAHCVNLNRDVAVFPIDQKSVLISRADEFWVVNQK